MRQFSMLHRESLPKPTIVFQVERWWGRSLELDVVEISYIFIHFSPYQPHSPVEKISCA